MIQPGLDKLSIQELQQAVMGMNPAIKPFEALGALQKRVKDEEMKNSQAMQMPDQPPVAQAAIQQAQHLEQQVQNPYMASGLGAAPVAPPVQSDQGIVGMASGGSPVDGSMVSAPEIYEDDSTLADITSLEKSYDTPQHSSPFFAGGGEVKHFGEGGQGLTPYERGKFTAADNSLGTPTTTNPYGFWNYLTGQSQPSNMQAERAKNMAIVNSDNPRVQMDAGNDPRSTLYQQPDAMGTPTPAALPTTQQGAPAVNTVANPLAQSAPQPTGPGLAGAKSGMGLNLNTAGVGLGAVNPMTETVDSPEQMVATRDKFLGTAEDRKAAHAEELKPFQDIADDYKKNIDSEKNNRMAEAMIAAGLGIAGGTSPNALTNIANGAKEGLAAIQSSKKAEQEARDKMASANLQMAAAKISLNKGDREEADKFMTNYYTDKHQANMYNLTADHFAHNDAAEALKAKASMLDAQNKGAYYSAIADSRGDMQKWHEDQTKINALKGMESDLVKQLSSIPQIPSMQGKITPLQQQLDGIRQQRTRQDQRSLRSLKYQQKASLYKCVMHLSGS